MTGRRSLIDAANLKVARALPESVTVRGQVVLACVWGRAAPGAGSPWFPPARVAA
jgi:hypothetical protein